MPRSVVFRTDSSTAIGSGHLMRCLTLAQALRDRGAQILFVCRELPGNLCALVEGEGFEICRLPQSDVRTACENVIGPNWKSDSEQTATAIETWGKDPDWLIVDQYKLEEQWERSLRPYVRKIMVVDDLADRRHDCDLLLDQNYTEVARYQPMVPGECRLLLGPEFALLKPEYGFYRAKGKVVADPPKRVLVFLGGGAPYRVVELALEVLSFPEFADLEVDLVVGLSTPNRDELVSKAQARPRTNLYGGLPHLAELMFGADLCIGAGGATTWERLCLGLPTLVVTLADNQIPLAQQLDAAGAIRWIGNFDQITTAHLRKCLNDEIGSRTCIQMSAIGAKLCDGNGVSRVVNAMIECAICSQ